MRWLIAVLGLCISGQVVAQHCFSGFVVDEVSKNPIQGAELLIPEELFLVKTDAAGQFALCDVKSRSLTFQVVKEGYKTYVSTVNFNEKDTVIFILLSNSTLSFSEILVSANRAKKENETPTIVESYSITKLRELGAFSISDGLAKMPGISQLNTGPGISKPVIRGLFGNRIQTVMMGQRFDNQQWQDEHGLGLSDVGVDHVEVIKGAASLLYGSEAMGGVINVVEEKPAPMNSIVGDVSTRYFSNTYGNATDLGIKGANAKFNWRLRGGIETHADYSDGNQKRILNSRFGGYYAKASMGFRKQHWLSQNDYMFSLNNFGFLMDSSLLQLTLDGRQSRSFKMPHHSVYLNAFSSQNTFYLRATELKWIAGAQVNDRQEQEGGSKISLDMILTSLSSNLLWTKQLTQNFSLKMGSQQLVQRNKNVGSRTIVPDAWLIEGSLFSYAEYRRKWFTVETGIRYTLKNIQTFTTGSINNLSSNPGTDILPFNNLYNAVTGALGISMFDSKNWVFKTNLSSGFRPGNLAELSSNGLHEGSVRYEIGNTYLKTEKNVCVDVLLRFNTPWITMSSSAYINHFFDYIYLTPTNQEYIGFQIFRYIQKNATLKGLENTVELTPQKFPWLQLKVNHSCIVGRTSDGDYLPFIPAQKLSGEMRLTGQKKWLKTAFIRISGDYVFDQKTPGQFETATAHYFLLSAGMGKNFNFGKHLLTVSLNGTNLLNNTYYDHLSRYKYFGIYNMGRNIVCNVKMTF